MRSRHACSIFNLSASQKKKKKGQLASYAYTVDLVRFFSSFQERSTLFYQARLEPTLAANCSASALNILLHKCVARMRSDIEVKEYLFTWFNIFLLGHLLHPRHVDR